MGRARVVVRDLTKTFREDAREVFAVAGVSFEIGDGEFVALAADRIVVMTRRPGRVKLIHDVKLPRPRDVITLRASDEYAQVIGIVMALGIKQVEARLLRWRPEYRKP